MRDVFEDIKKFISNNFFVIFFALFVGFVSVLPQILAIEALGDSYRGIPFLYDDSGYSYLSRIQEIKDGHLLASSPMLHEYKNYQVIMPPTAEYFYFLGSKLFSVSIINFVYLSKFIFPTILFLLIYLFVYRLTEKRGDTFLRKFNAVTCGLFVTLGYELLNYNNLLSLFRATDHLSLSIWTRLVNPIAGAVLLFLFFIFIWEILHGKRGLIIPSAIVLFIMSGYVFSLGLAALFLLIINTIFLLKKEYQISKDLFYVFLLFLSFLTVFLFFSLDPQALSNDSYRMGLFLTHEPMLNKLLLVLSVIFLSISFYFQKKKKYILEKDNWWLFSVSIIIASFISFNQQVITGMTVWPQHLVQYTIPISSVLFMILLYNFFSDRKKLCLFFLSVVSLLSVFTGIRDSLTYEHVMHDFFQRQEYGDLISWIEVDAPEECVVMTIDQSIKYLVPSLTHCDTYFYDWVFSGVPEDRVLFNYLLNLRLKGIDNSSVDSYISTNRGELITFFYRDWRDLFLSNNDPWLNKISDKKDIEKWLDSLTIELSSRFKEFTKGNLSEQIKKYRVDYVIIDDSNIRGFDGIEMELIKEIDGFKIYKI